jgi:peptide/nickel transport system permease protein
MGAFLLRRVMVMIPTLIAASILIFTIIQLPPGDYLSTLIAEMEARGESIDPNKIAVLREAYGLDSSVVVQYLHWVGGMLVGDFGYSFEYALPVSRVVGDQLWLTALLSIGTILFIWLLSFPIALYSATHRHTPLDLVLTFLGFLGLAIPNFLLALVLLFLANRLFDISMGGLMAPEYMDAPWSWGKVISVFEHLWVPVIVIGTSGTAAMIRRLRANLLDELHKPYVSVARAKGLAPGRLLWKYPLRVSLIPFVADVGNLLPQVISGGAVVSIVLSLPTTGPMLLRALRAQDTYLAGSFLMFLAVLTMVGVLISDIALGLIDPRIRAEERAQS